MAWTQTELDALKKAYASGVLRVSYEGKSVQYDDADVLLRRIRVIEQEIAASSGQTAPRRSFASFSKG
ncbi:MAG: hypothetical protein HQL50_04095 [Magnetococcales bacterium]|nr:hypothetical protein [Magnetococcales bacterium]